VPRGLSIADGSLWDPLTEQRQLRTGAQGRRTSGRATDEVGTMAAHHGFCFGVTERPKREPATDASIGDEAGVRPTPNAAPAFRALRDWPRRLEDASAVLDSGPVGPGVGTCRCFTPEPAWAVVVTGSDDWAVQA
jgi:hypothetical protein